MPSGRAFMSASSSLKLRTGLVALTSEGKTVEVPYRGPVRTTVDDILGGLRSACTYVGAARLKELNKRTTFIRVTQQLNTVFSGLRDTSRKGGQSAVHMRPPSAAEDQQEGQPAKRARNND